MHSTTIHACCVTYRSQTCPCSSDLLLATPLSSLSHQDLSPCRTPPFRRPGPPGLGLGHEYAQAVGAAIEVSRPVHTNVAGCVRVEAEGIVGVRGGASPGWGGAAGTTSATIAPRGDAGGQGNWHKLGLAIVIGLAQVSGQVLEHLFEAGIG